MEPRHPISAAKIVAAREARGFSQHKLATLAGTHSATIYRYERSDREASRMSMKTLAAIADALGQPVSAFFVDDPVAA